MQPTAPTLEDYRLLKNSPAWQQALADFSRRAVSEPCPFPNASAGESALWRLALQSELADLGRYIDERIKVLEKELEPAGKR